MDKGMIAARGFIKKVFVALIATILAVTLCLPQAGLAYAAQKLPRVLGGSFSIAAADGSSWDVSAGQDCSVIASAVALEDGTYALSVEGTGPMRDYASAADVPYAALLGDSITQMAIGEGVTSVGAYAGSLSNLTKVTAGSTLTTVADNAFEGATSLVALDFSAADLESVGANAFGQAGARVLPERTLYVKDAASAAVVQAYASDARACTALAVTNEGAFADDTVFEAGALATPERAGYAFSTWTNDEDLMHPVTEWEPMTKAVFYARFVEIQQPDEPEAYAGYQGLDQTVTLYDPDRLPSLVVNSNVLFCGEGDTCYDNRFQTAFNGRDDIVFAFGMGRGSNANGGDGSYQLSFSLPYVSIVNADGETVAAYDNGNGLLRKINIVFDGVEGKTTGNTIYAVRIGVAANTLPAGEYTLRFGKDFGANNGISFLGKDVDFKFTVEYPELYELEYATDAASRAACVSGIAVDSGVTDAIDVAIPETVDVDGVTYAVTAIGDGAFKDQGRVASVDMPATVTSIGSEAFSDMAALAKVVVRAKGDNVLPAWGYDVFEGSSAGVAGSVCKLYGFVDSSVSAEAEACSNVAFVSLDDGLYVNDALLEEGVALEFTADGASAELRIMSDGQDVTTSYTAAISNTNVVSHGGTGSFVWNTLTAQANGLAQLVISGADGAVYRSVSVNVSGMDKDASVEAAVLDSAQGNGSTVQLTGAGEVKTISFDETKDYFDNYLTDPIEAGKAQFTLELGGPGSAWGPGHAGWRWNAFRENVDANLCLLDVRGQVVATVGNGLTWTYLTTDNLVTFAVDPGILNAGETYTLVAGAGFSGHNASATLMKAVHWTFAVSATSLSNVAAADIPAQTWTGALLEPVPEMTLPAQGIAIWNDEMQCVETTMGKPYTLVAGSDFSVVYEAGDTPGKNVAVVMGQGGFGSSVTLSFDITQELAGDVNASGKVNIVDAQLVFDSANDRLSSLSVGRIIWALSDINADSVVDADDARALQVRIHG